VPLEDIITHGDPPVTPGDLNQDHGDHTDQAGTHGEDQAGIHGEDQHHQYHMPHQHHFKTGITGVYCKTKQLVNVYKPGVTETQLSNLTAMKVNKVRDTELLETVVIKEYLMLQV